MCGEHFGAFDPAPPSGGSAPHVRGTHCAGGDRGRIDRFSPACAGNTWRRESVIGISAVQPRMCGEHTSSGCIGDPVYGSAPHVRGTREKLILDSRAKRFSPACAGNTPATPSLSIERPVQPRMCGEHRHSSTRPIVPCGSAPHVRGTLDREGAIVGPTRFSPACAGNTEVVRRGTVGRTVQPRMCGEHSVKKPAGTVMTGSAPHVRGTRTRPLSWRRR